LPPDEIKFADHTQSLKKLIGNDWIEVAERGGLFAGHSSYCFKGPYAKFPLSQKYRNRHFSISGKHTIYSKTEAKQKNTDRGE